MQTRHSSFQYTWLLMYAEFVPIMISAMAYHFLLSLGDCVDPPWGATEGEVHRPLLQNPLHSDDERARSQSELLAIGELAEERPHDCEAHAPLDMRTKRLKYSELDFIHVGILAIQAVALFIFVAWEPIICINSLFQNGITIPDTALSRVLVIAAFYIGFVACMALLYYGVTRVRYEIFNFLCGEGGGGGAAGIAKLNGHKMGAWKREAICHNIQSILYLRFALINLAMPPGTNVISDAPHVVPLPSTFMLFTL